MSLHKDMKFVVTWTTSDGKRHNKVYDEYAEARKAVSWLTARGVLDADLAIRLPHKAEDEDV